MGSNPTPRTTTSASTAKEENCPILPLHLPESGLSLSKDERPIAYPVTYNGPGHYPRPFQGTGYGVMFDDDGATGYLYATNEVFDQILDSLHLYNVGNKACPKEGDDVFIVWNAELQKAGIYYANRFQAVIDFKNKLTCCRSGFPPKGPGLWSASHTWNDTMTKGLEP